MPAIDLLNIQENEGKEDAMRRDIALLFVASGDLRNVVKTIVGLPEDHKGECMAVINDKEFIIVARNVIMLLVAMYFDPEVATPIIIRLWYSAFLPVVMVQTLQSHIMPLFEDVCGKIKTKPASSLQAKTFTINNHRLRIILKKEEWSELVKYFSAPETLTVEEANSVRRRVTLAPERIDYRDRAKLQWSRALRQVDTHFRETGVFLPYGCSLEAFDTPNP
jgi:hypothetical protein